MMNAMHEEDFLMGLLAVAWLGFICFTVSGIVTIFTASDTAAMAMFGSLVAWVVSGIWYIRRVKG